MAAQPKVSVGLPVYNGERYLPNALTRLLSQDFSDFELIISDNASTDGTQAICQAYARKDSRIRYFRNEANVGLAANHNRAFLLSRGEFFKWAAHDDDFPSAMLGRFVEAFARAPRAVAMVYSRCEYIDELDNVQGIDSDGVDTNNPWPHQRLAHFLRHIHMYNSAYGLMRSEILRRTRLYGLYPMSDYVLLSELAMLGPIVELPEPLLRIRRHPGRTFTAHHTSTSLRELFSPGRKHRMTLVSVRTRAELELVRSAVLVPTNVRDKVLCVAVAILKPQWEAFRAFAGRHARRLTQMFTRKAAESRD
jgi:glycosyltransferase involved in cell wall biosynthesis